MVAARFASCSPSARSGGPCGNQCWCLLHRDAFQRASVDLWNWNPWHSSHRRGLGQFGNEFAHRCCCCEISDASVIVLIGYLAAIVDVGQFTPQLWRAIKRRNDETAMSGISLVAYAIATTQAILWIVYGFATNRLPIGVPNTFIAPACLYIFVLALRSRMRSNRSC